MTEGEIEHLARLIRSRVEATDLSLRNMTVLTEAATGAYASTSVAASLAGARVYALAASSIFGSVEDATRDVENVASIFGLAGSIVITSDRSEIPWQLADIVTNSGFLRPITRRDMSRMPREALIALMYEAWEARTLDLDFEAASELGIEVIGVDERHPYCGAFDWLGDLVWLALQRRSWHQRHFLVGLLADNDFEYPIARKLREVGMEIRTMTCSTITDCDVLVLASKPEVVPGGRSASELTSLVLETRARACVNLWGDIDYSVLQSSGIELEPETQPGPGRQGIGMHESGFEPVVRLQVAGLAAVTYRDVDSDAPSFGLAQRHVELNPELR